MGTYIVVRQSPKFHQMSIDEMLGLKNYVDGILNDPSSDTRTYVTNKVNSELVDAVGVDFLIKKLHDFNEKNGHLIDDIREYESIPKNKRLNVKDRVYYEFLVPKHDGKMRTIDAPRDDLSEALRELKYIFENYFHALYHTSAFAYVKNRSIVKCLKRHQNNESQWYAKFDLHGFFPSTTEDFVMNQFSMVFPFSEVIKVPEGREELRKALSLAFLDGGLPQGTPISPLITNVMMIPIDYQLYKKLRDFNGNRFVYTRYADDFTISSKYAFKFKDVEQLIIDTLAAYNAPFVLNTKKTRYGSRSGSNWNFGIMINKDNKMTVGYKNKKRLKAMLSSYALDKVNNANIGEWDIEKVQSLQGTLNYYRMIEKDTIDDIVRHLSDKYHIDIDKAIKNDISQASKEAI